MVATIPIPSDDDQLRISCNKRSRATGSVNIDEGQKYACVVLKLNPGVSQPGDYATLKSNIESVLGIQSVSLLIDGQIPTLPADSIAKLLFAAQMRVEEVIAE